MGNNDGTISAKHHPHLVLGLEKPTACGLSLVKRGSPEQAIFQDMNLLKQGRVASGKVNGGTASLGIKYFEERRHDVWRYIESQCVPNDSINVIEFEYVDQNYLKVVGKDLVFDVAFWQMKEGTPVNFVGAGAGHVHTKQGGGGRDWTLNNDGTISAKHHPHLVLGFISTAKIEKQENKQNAKTTVYDTIDVNPSTDN